MALDSGLGKISATNEGKKIRYEKAGLKRVQVDLLVYLHLDMK